jgi:hypothetical protein
MGCGNGPGPHDWGPATEREQPDGRGWATPADIEGNEFCVERSTGERSA